MLKLRENRGALRNKIFIRLRHDLRINIYGKFQ